ncbi:hypothetical protein SAMN05660831_00031 [Thiohalospira halophila DSM 15071]|uniref:Uncharacterized protein n=1 Tax=Thiohalospira halophila DSM 15071 TaxID=1123397 RepID=A0A1I1MYR1_9GAMM|nr:hypothetical protein [Thiohalospira halophila]SFC90509.1 hypothetical protein SAMN05660831_00031 [Thiohalospira halophila DSM 15071]
MRTLQLLLATITLLNAGCASLIPGGGIEEGKTFKATATATSKRSATEKALRQGAFKAEKIGITTTVRTGNGEVEEYETRTESPVYLYDYEELNYSRRGSMHTVTVSATYLRGDRRQIRELLADVQKTMRDVRRIEPLDPRKYAWTHEADHLRSGHFLALVPMELRIYPRPEGVDRPWDVGVYIEAAYDHSPPGDGPNGKDREEWAVDTTWMGFIPWTYSPSAGLIVSADVGIADRALVGREDFDDPEPEEIGLPESEGWSPSAGVRMDAVLRSGWGVHYSTRHIEWQEGPSDRWQRAEIFKEWYREDPGPIANLPINGERIMGYRLSLGYTRLDGGVMDDYSSATLQFGFIF